MSFNDNYSLTVIERHHDRMGGHDEDDGSGEEDDIRIVSYIHTSSMQVRVGAKVSRHSRTLLSSHLNNWCKQMFIVDKFYRRLTMW
jgi:hypothetical protein